MLFVCRMAFSTFFLPYMAVYFREESVGGHLVVFHFCQIEAVGQREGLHVEHGSSDDEDFFFLFAGFQGFFQRVETFRSFKMQILFAQHDVSPVRQGAFGEGFKGMPSHQNGMACGECLEAFQVIGQPVKQLVLVADTSFLIDGGDDG